MTRRLLHPSRLFALAFALLTAASCGDAATGIAGRDAGSLRPLVDTTSQPTLLACDPASTTQTATGIIGPLGGTLAIGATSVTIPANAVLAPTSFQLTIPASRLVEISVKAGNADHYVFLQPVVVTIDYGRCAGSLSPLTALSAWNIDEATKAPLENMGGVDARLLHTITFATIHFSGYAVAD